MSGSSSSPTNTTTTSTQAQETNSAATNTQGVTIVGNSGNTSLTENNITTCGGAVAAAVGLGSKAIAANTGLSESVSTCSFNFANHALDVISQEQTQSASLVSNYLSQGAAELNQAEAGFLSIASENSQAENQQIGNVSATLSSIASQQVANQTQNAQASSSMQMALVLGLAAVVLVVFLTHKGH